MPIDPDALAAEEHDVHRVQPYNARKTYLCPGCQQNISPGTGHLVVLPRLAPELRRHWHQTCWEHRHRRRVR